ncbi:hypothetical protein CRUP_024371 [Coryphaenoides rupestris]|nr:hypothetical protein CRUP_024371 [Coryphaenoides rupestris]
MSGLTCSRTPRSRHTEGHQSALGPLAGRGRAGGGAGQLGSEEAGDSSMACTQAVSTRSRLRGLTRRLKVMAACSSEASRQWCCTRGKWTPRCSRASSAMEAGPSAPHHTSSTHSSGGDTSSTAESDCRNTESVFKSRATESTPGFSGGTIGYTRSAQRRLWFKTDKRRSKPNRSQVHASVLRSPSPPHCHRPPACTGHARAPPLTVWCMNEKGLWLEASSPVTSMRICRSWTQEPRKDLDVGAGHQLEVLDRPAQVASLLGEGENTGSRISFNRSGAKSCLNTHLATLSATPPAGPEEERQDRVLTQHCAGAPPAGPSGDGSHSSVCRANTRFHSSSPVRTTTTPPPSAHSSWERKCLPTVKAPTRGPCCVPHTSRMPRRGA